MATPTGKREQLIQAARTWAKTLLGLTDSQVIPQMQGDDHGPAPEGSYLVVMLSSFGTDTGTVAIVYDQATSKEKRRAPRTATLNMYGYGDEAEDWLQTLAMFSDHYPEEAGSLQRVLAHTDVSIPNEENQFERIQRLDLLLEYHDEAEIDFTPALTYELTVTDDEGDSTHTGEL